MKKSWILITAVCAVCAACAGTSPAGTTDTAAGSKEEPSAPLSNAGTADGYTYEITEEDSYDARFKAQGYTVIETEENSIRCHIFSGEKSSGGYGIEVLSLKEENDILTVTVRETAPGPEDVVTTALTCPHITVSLTPAPKEIRVIGEDSSEYSRLEAEDLFPRVLMTEGNLYFDTGYIPAPIGRCGNMDGNCETILGRDQMPANNGEANFSFTGYQYSGTDTLDVLIDGEFRIFATKDSGLVGGEILPDNVLTFMAVADDVTDNEVIVIPMEDGPEFSNIKKDKRYVLPLSVYDPGLYVDKPVAGNVLLVACGGHIEEEGDPIEIPYVYRISPVGSSPIQKADGTENCS